MEKFSSVNFRNFINLFIKFIVEKHHILLPKIMSELKFNAANNYSNVLDIDTQDK